MRCIGNTCVRKNLNVTLTVFGSIVCLYLTGCGSRSTQTELLGSGYEEVTYTKSSFSEPESHQITLQYRNADGKQVIIWPSVQSKIFTGNAIAIFGAGTKFFAVKAPDHPVEITDEVLRQWSKESGTNFADAIKVASAGTLERRGDRIEFNFAFWAKETWPNAISLDWNQIAEIVSDVRQHGVQCKDADSTLIYWKKEVEPGIQK